MELSGLFAIQNGLDTTILKEHDLKESDVIEKRMLALLVETGELANETRCFKYWSRKEPSAKEVILEEYVDVFHFILSLGNLFDHTEKIINTDFNVRHAVDLTEEFMNLYESVITFREKPHFPQYLHIFIFFLSIGHALGFTDDDIYNAYMSKNKTNYERQQNGY